MRVVLFFIWVCALCQSRSAPLAEIRGDDIVAFTGGADVAAAQRAGHLETLLTLKWPTARFRNFGWEGDTVFTQPRDVNFPSLQEHLEKSGATVIVVQYGRAEALSGAQELSNFALAYRTLLSDFARITPRLILVTPIAFENPGGLYPNLATHNADLAMYAEKIRDIGQQMHFPVVDLFAALHDVRQRLTDDGLQLTPKGDALAAVAFAGEFGFDLIAKQAGESNAAGRWSNPDYERLRSLILEKDRLWFNYWRPQNWAFLGGDRTEQPSSRDYRDPKIRWFPAEMEKYPGLIAGKEAEIRQLAQEMTRRDQP